MPHWSLLTPPLHRSCCLPAVGPSTLCSTLPTLPSVQGTHWLIFYLKKRKRNGLAQAVSNLMLELTLVGFVSLLLIVLQGPIASICGKPGAARRGQH